MKDLSMPDPVEHATGLEKYELLAKQAGNEDPFFLKAVQRAKGTKDAPTIIHAMDNYRMVGCVCNEEDTNIKWTWLCEGVPKRCECGKLPHGRLRLQRGGHQHQVDLAV